MGFPLRFRRFLRRFARWSSTLLALACIVGCAASIQWYVRWTSRRNIAVGISHGASYVAWNPAQTPVLGRTTPGIAGWTSYRWLLFRPEFWTHFAIRPRAVRSGGQAYVSVPFWLILAMVAGPAAWLWWRDWPPRPNRPPDRPLRRAAGVLRAAALLSLALLALAALIPFAAVLSFGSSGASDRRTHAKSRWPHVYLEHPSLVIEYLRHAADGVPDVDLNSAGLAWSRAGFEPGSQFCRLRLPLWLPTIALLLPPAVAYWRGPARRRRYWLRGHCLVCGYNLTGNISGVCPECGLSIARPPVTAIRSEASW